MGEIQAEARLDLSVVQDALETAAEDRAVQHTITLDDREALVVELDGGQGQGQEERCEHGAEEYAVLAEAARKPVHGAYDGVAMPRKNAPDKTLRFRHHGEVVGAEWFALTPVKAAQFYKASAKGKLPCIALFEEGTYAWFEFWEASREEGEARARALASLLGVAVSFEERPMATLQLHHPRGAGHSWGIVMRGPSLSRRLVERAVGRLPFFEQVEKSPLLQKIKAASPFFQCDSPDYLYLEFLFVRPETALAGAKALAEYTGCPLDLEEWDAAHQS